MAKTKCEKKECCTTCDVNVGDDIVEIIHITRLISPEKGGKKVFESSVQTKMVKPGKSIVKREHKCYFISAADDPYEQDDPDCARVCGMEDEAPAATTTTMTNDTLLNCHNLCDCQNRCRQRYYEDIGSDSDGC